jgi:signal transduction histidine kinase
VILDKKDISNLSFDCKKVTEQLDLIYVLTQKLSTGSELNEVLNLFAEKVALIFDAKGSSIRLIKSPGLLTEIVASFGLSEEYLLKGEIDLGRSEINREVLLGNIVEVKDILESSLFQYSKEISKEGFNSIIGAPITATDKEIIGILKLYFSANKVKLDTEDKKMLETLCNQTGLLIQNSLAIKKFKEIDRNKSLFLTTITHQLRAPVAGLQSLLKIIYDGYVGEINEKQKELIDRGIKRTNYLLNLISDLLSIASTELQIKKEFTKLPFVEIIVSVIDTLNELISEKELKLHLIKPNKELFIYGNEEDIRKATENIIENAVKYTPEKGKIDVVLEEKQNFITIMVKDSGIGIPRDSLQNLFHDFYRSSNAKEFSDHGTGLGLSIVKRIVEDHKGRVFLTSEINKGTTIKLFFPKFIKDTNKDDTES